MGPLSRIALALFVSVSVLVADAPVVLNFEGLHDGDPVTTQLPTFTFTNAVALTAGISLNEFEFPPASGTKAVVDEALSLTRDPEEPTHSRRQEEPR